MLVGKIHTNPIQNNKINYGKPVTNTQVMSSHTELSKGIDGKFYVNINFKGANELILSVLNDDVRNVRRELRNGTDINSLYNGTNALLAAAKNDRHECLDELLKYAGLNVNAQNENGYTALMLADAEATRKLLRHPDIDVNITNNNGDTALIRAICEDETEKAAELIRCPNIDLSIRENSGNGDALYWAWNKDNEAIMDMLIAHPDIDINAKYDDDRTLLTLTIICDADPYIEEFFSNPNLDVNIQDNYGKTALMHAVDNSNVSLDTVRELLKHPKIDVNVQDNNGDTAIIIAIENEFDATVAQLLKRDDIDLTIEGELGTALDIAKRKDTIDENIFEELAEKTEYQLEHPESIRNRSKNIIKKPPVDINKLAPEENIWTKEEISTEFLELVKGKKYDDAVKMLEMTPLIDLNRNKKEILKQVTLTGAPDFAIRVFDYMFHQQDQMKPEYDARRKEFLENTVQTLSYDELKKNNVALNTVEGFKILMGKSEFNPNDKYEDMSLFERACAIDSEGNLVKQILDKYEDVNTEKAVKTRNQTIKDLINEYESVGKYKMLLNNIKDNTTREETRKLAAQQLSDLIESENFKPEMTDSYGNTVLHIAAALPEDSARMLIVKSMEKGVDINAENIVGGRPLMSAIMKLQITKDEEGRRSMLSNIRFLLDKGANVDAQDQIGQTALHFACSTTIPILLTMLLSKDPNVFIKDKHGCRACTYLKTDEMKKIYDDYVKR